MIGKTISHYKIIEKLGEGGMGVVYKAEDTKLDRVVALKFLSPQALGSGDEKTRFMHEARAVAALNHPNICTIHEIDEHDENSFIAMEYIAGESLKARIESGPLKLEEAANITLQVAAGLSEAHKKGIVHRDIKSANIMFNERGDVKIMDFGLAWSADRTQLTRAGTTLGTVAYMSPEQGRGEAVDHRTDIWSLGVILYEMVAGLRPFNGDYEQAVVYLILNEEAKPLSILRSEVPPELERIVRKALAKNRDGRYQNIDTLKSDLTLLRELLRANDPLEKTIIEKAKPSIAVLPFRDMSSQKDQDYFCEGIAEELINALVKLDGLRVAARTSAFQYKDRGSDIKKIGSQLEVKTVLEGSIRKSGNRLRITAQLINVEDGFHIWSEKYDRDFDDIFAIQDEISLAIVDKLKVRLLGQEKKRLVKRHTENQEAHNLYLKGLYFWNRRLEGGMKMAMDHFQQAMEKDPDYALAHVGIADTHNITGFFGYLSPKETFPKAKAAAMRALEIDDTLSEAHTSLAFAIMCYDWDWHVAEKEFRQALDLDPNYATAHEWYALLLFATGRFDEAIMEAERSRELDPLSLIINAVVGIAYYFARRYDESIAQHQKALEMDPNFLLASTYIILAYGESGRFDDAIATMRRVETMAAGHAYTLGKFGWAYGKSGEKKEALRILDKLDKLAKERYVCPIHRANILSGLNRTNEALDMLEKAFQEKSPDMIFSKTIPVFDQFRSNPRFKALLEKIGLEE